VNDGALMAVKKLYICLCAARDKAAVSQLKGQLAGDLESTRAVEFRSLNWARAFINPVPGFVQRRSNMWWSIAALHGVRTPDFAMTPVKSEEYRLPCATTVEGFLEKHGDTFCEIPLKVALYHILQY
jgi:hypothetical protein